MLEDFIKYAKEEYGIIIIPKESNNPDTFEKLFGGLFIKDDFNEVTIKKNL